MRERPLEYSPSGGASAAEWRDYALDLEKWAQERDEDVRKIQVRLGQLNLIRDHGPESGLAYRKDNTEAEGLLFALAALGVKEDKNGISASEDERCHSDGPCMDCGRRDIAFSVSHKLWAEVRGLPPGENPGILCPGCFTGRAIDRGIYLGIWTVSAIQQG